MYICEQMYRECVRTRIQTLTVEGNKSIYKMQLGRSVIGESCYNKYICTMMRYVWFQA